MIFLRPVFSSFGLTLFLFFVVADTVGGIAVLDEGVVADWREVVPGFRGRALVLSEEMCRTTVHCHGERARIQVARSVKEKLQRASSQKQERDISKKMN